MGSLGKLVLPLSVEHLTLLKFLIGLLVLIHVPFISMLLGGAIFAVGFNLVGKSERNPTYLRFARELMETFAYRKSVGLALGVFPLAALTIIYIQILQGAEIRVGNIFASTLVLATAGLILLYWYHATFDWRDRRLGWHTFLGLGGILLLLAAYLGFTSGTSLILDPEKWRVVRSPKQVLFSWNVVTRYLQFLWIVLTFTGAGVLFFFLRWRTTEPEEDAPYREFTRRFGAGIMLAAALTYPLFLLWDLVTLPPLAFSAGTVAASVAVLFLLFLLSLLLVRSLQRPEGRYGTIFGLSLVLLLALFIRESASRESAIQEHTALLIAQAEALKSERLLARGEAEEAGVSQGESVFKSRCVTCHSFDKRVVGPPLATVLPKYVEDRTALMDFIRNPTKKNPGYPPMPKLGLRESEIESVTAYLLDRIKQQGNTSQ